MTITLPNDLRKDSLSIITHFYMKKKILLLVALVAAIAALHITAGAKKAIVNLRTCYQQNPLGMEETPDFSWQMIDDQQYCARQKAYRIVVATSPEALKKEEYVYDTGKVDSDLSVCIPYTGAALKPCTRYYWKVYVWDERDKMTSSKEEAWFETALMSPEGWAGAEWIGSSEKVLSKYIGMGEIHLDFTIDEGSHQATLVMGCRDDRNYVMVEITTENPDQPLLKLIQVVDGKESVVRDQNIADLLPKAVQHQKHHLCLKFLAENYYRSYGFDITLDGKDINQGKYAPKEASRLTVQPHPDDLSYIYCRLYSIGFRQSEGQRARFEGLHIIEPFHQALLYESKEVYDVQGNGSLRVWSPGEEHSAPMLRKKFKIEKPIKSARLYATARGIYEVMLNGRAVAEDFFNPGWTDYRMRQNYNTFDVTKLVEQGDNAIGVTLGTGWYTGTAAHTPLWSNQYGTEISFLGKLVITHTDNSVTTVTTSPEWRCYDHGPVVSEGWLDGEDYDARKEIPNWSRADFDDSQWKPAKRYDAPADNVVMQAYIGQPIRVDEIRTAQRMTEPQPKHFIYDMGQNMVGVPRIRIKGQEGQEVTLRYCEMLYPEVIPTDPVAPYTIEMYQRKRGQIYTDNYRSALSTDHYICKGEAKGEVIEPHFTSHGFRYIEITGLDKAPRPQDVQVLVLNSLDPKQTCSYETSDSLINRLYSNVIWGQKSNFLSVPTDCPQRDERLGWSGDAQIFTRTATYNRQMSPFYTRWLYSVRDAQGDDGNHSHFIPSIGDIPAGGGRGGTAFGWAEVGIVTPWQLYQQYGNVSILRQNYESMKRYMDYVERHANNYIQPLGGYGDWVALRGTISDLTNTCYSAYDAQIMSKVAQLLGHDEDSRHYADLFNNIKQAFAKRYLREGGKLIKPAGSPGGTDSFAAAFGGGGITQEDQPIDSQTGYIIPLYMNLLDGDVRKQAAAHLVQLIKDNNYCLNTGFIGTPYLNIVLSDNGYDEIAYKLFQQESYPSWLYPILQGATTIWERWNSYTLKNGFGPVEMNSFNHYSYGSIQDWMMAYSAGIQRDENHPGYKQFILQPRIGGKLTYVKASYESVYGLIRSYWQSDHRDVATLTDASQHGYTYSATVPANTTARLILPLTGKEKKVRVNKGEKGITDVVTQDDHYECTLAPGYYQFQVE